MHLGVPASPTASVDGIPLAGPGFNVVVDPVKEKALWDKWGEMLGFASWLQKKIGSSIHDSLLE